MPHSDYWGSDPRCGVGCMEQTLAVMKTLILNHVTWTSLMNDEKTSNKLSFWTLDWRLLHFCFCSVGFKRSLNQNLDLENHQMPTSILVIRFQISLKLITFQSLHFTISHLCWRKMINKWAVFIMRDGWRNTSAESPSCTWVNLLAETEKESLIGAIATR